MGGIFQKNWAKIEINRYQILEPTSGPAQEYGSPPKAYANWIQMITAI